MPGAASPRHSLRALQKKKFLILDLNGVLADITNVKKLVSGLMATFEESQVNKLYYPLLIYIDAPFTSVSKALL